MAKTYCKEAHELHFLQDDVTAAAPSQQWTYSVDYPVKPFATRPGHHTCEQNPLPIIRSNCARARRAALASKVAWHFEHDIAPKHV